MHQIAENRGINPDKVLQKVFVCKVLNAGQLEMVAQHLGKSIQEYAAFSIFASLTAFSIFLRGSILVITSITISIMTYIC